MINPFHSRSRSRSRRKENRRPLSTRTLSLEPLESRALLAADGFLGIQRFVANWIDNDAAEIARFVSPVTHQTGTAASTSATSAARAAALADDSYEENDTSSQASNLGTITAAVL